MIHRIYTFITENKWSYRIFCNVVRVCGSSYIQKGKGCKIKKCKIFLKEGATLKLGTNVILTNCRLYINGHVTIDDYTTLSDGFYNIEDGSVCIGHHCKIVAKRFWVRFGGKVTIGDFTNINEGSEIRCDEQINIGSYNQISYGVNIWDTNTHNILPAEERRALTEKYWPYFGKELTRPKTNPVVIGDDCWIGEKATILKGSVLGHAVIVGYGTVISNKYLSSGVFVSSLNIRSV